MTSAGAYPFDSRVLTRGRAERLNHRIVEAGTAVRDAVRKAAQAQGDTLVGRLVHGQGHLSSIADGLGPSIGTTMVLSSAGALLGLGFMAFGAATAGAIIRIATDEMPREALWLAEAYPTVLILVGLALVVLSIRRLFARNVDEMASVPRRLVQESAFCLGIGRDRLYAASTGRKGVSVREIPYADVRQVTVQTGGLLLGGHDGRRILAVSRCWDEGDEAACQAMVAHLRERTAP